MNRFINHEVVFNPEVYKDVYLIGHTGNYLSVKMKSDKKLLNQEVKGKIESVNYPYVMASMIDIEA